MSRLFFYIQLNEMFTVNDFEINSFLFLFEIK